MEGGKQMVLTLTFIRRVRTSPCQVAKGQGRRGSEETKRRNKRSAREGEGRGSRNKG
jgi:hypothetical protein